MGLTVVAFHAHPDDEAILSGGTLARAAAAGHRVVIVTATRGEEGLAAARYGSGDALGRRRMSELQVAASALGCAEVQWLGYRDSGVLDRGDHHDAFARADVGVAAEVLASVLRDLDADVLITYDRNGGYGHPDHRAAHQVGMRAAALAGTTRVLQVTLPGDVLRIVQRALGLLRHPLRATPAGTTGRFVRRREITHVVRVGDALGAKRRAMAAHASQRTAPDGSRVLDHLLALPLPVSRLVLGREWYVDVSPGVASCGATSGRRRDLFPLESSAS